MSNLTIDWAKAMETVDSDIDFLNEVIGDLLNEAQTSQEEIEAGIAKPDYSAVSKAAHRVKGSASYLCCENLRQVSLSLQDLGTAAHASPSPSTVNEIKSLFEKYKDCVVELRKEVEYHQKK
jgi:HPt (histidine-containing phosphotransfer) domain-containing protein